METFNDNFPYVSTSPPVIIVALSPQGSSVINDITNQFSRSLKKFLYNKKAVQYISGFWELKVGVCLSFSYE